MTPLEFKAWFDGFTENLKGPPNAKQWKRICKRVKEIDSTSIFPLFVERWRPYRVYFGDAWSSSTSKASRISEIWTTDEAQACLYNAGKAEFKQIEASASA